MNCGIIDPVWFGTKGATGRAQCCSICPAQVPAHPLLTVRAGWAGSAIHFTLLAIALGCLAIRHRAHDGPAAVRRLTPYTYGGMVGLMSSKVFEVRGTSMTPVARRLVLLLGMAGFIVMADNWVVSPILPAISKSVGVRPEAAGILIAA